MSAGSIRRGSGTVTNYLLYSLRDGMKDSLMEALHNASRKELIDMIEERMHMDPAFRKIVEHRLRSDTASDPDKQISAFQNQVMDEMTREGAMTI